MKIVLVLVILLDHLTAYCDFPCRPAFDRGLPIYGLSDWVPDYPLGFTRFRQLKYTFSDAFVKNICSDVLYPKRSPYFPDLSDTIEVDVRFVNADTVPLVIKDVNVESWVVPLVFEIGDQIETSTSLAGPPSVKWRVRYWWRSNGIETRPDTIHARGEWYMKLDVWDVPEGKYQLAIMGTDSVPEWFDVMPRSDFYHMLPAKNLADSINAWATIFERVMADGNPDGAKVWLDSIMTYNPLSTVGFYETAKYYWENDDSAGTVENFDAVLLRLADWDDPALPDTTDLSFDRMNLKWKHFMMESVTQEREMYINCPELR